MRRLKESEKKKDIQRASPFTLNLRPYEAVERGSPRSLEGSFTSPSPA